MSPAEPSLPAPTPPEPAPLPEPAAPGTTATRRASVARYFNVIGLVLGAALLVVLILKLDLQQVAARLRQVGWIYLGTLAAYVLGLAATAAGWQSMVDPARSRARFRDFFAAFWAGQAINSLTPGGQLGSVMRGTFLRHKVETQELIASLVTLTFFGATANLIVNLVAPLLCLALLDLPARVVLVVFAVAVALFVPLVLLYLFLRRGAAATVVRVLRKIPFVRLKDPERLAEAAHDVDTRIREFRRQRPRLFRRAVFWTVMARALLATEYWVLLLALVHDRGALWLGTMALLTQASSQLLGWIVAFVPSQVGVAEANTTVLYKLLGFDPVVGLTVEIGRRMRTIFGIVAGLLIGWALGLTDVARKDRREQEPPRAADDARG